MGFVCPFALKGYIDGRQKEESGADSCDMEYLFREKL